eukprot:4923787-Pyramimonas_sp.AAC.1
MGPRSAVQGGGDACGTHHWGVRPCASTPSQLITNNDHKQWCEILADFNGRQAAQDGAFRGGGPAPRPPGVCNPRGGTRG